jgi:hypothetical protein
MKTIRQVAVSLGISPQALYEKLKTLGIEPKISEETGWRVLTDAQIKELNNTQRDKRSK